MVMLVSTSETHMTSTTFSVYVTERTRSPDIILYPVKLLLRLMKNVFLWPLQEFYISSFPAGVLVHVMNTRRIEHNATQCGHSCVTFYAFKFMREDQMW